MIIQKLLIIQKTKYSPILEVSFRRNSGSCHFMILSIDGLVDLGRSLILRVSNGVSRKAVSESLATSGSRSSAYVAGREKNFTVRLYINSDVYGLSEYCSRSQSGTPPSHAHVCSPAFAFPSAHVRSRKESGKYFAGFTRDGGDFTGKPRPIVLPLALPIHRSLFLARVDREVRIISPFAEATMCGTGRTLIYETGVAVKSQIATQICRADNVLGRNTLEPWSGQGEERELRAVGTSRGLVLTTRL